ncbi:hypothetical protein C8R46DRAFT_463259 [Mycena filopes]|nr:hypothetical protein C8R46DRAFT_463259 [Mycena filopes]
MSSSNLGALEIGTLLSYVLLGASMTQTYTYYSRFPNDSRNLKCLVAFVWLLEVAHGICIGYSLSETISNYIHLNRVNSLPSTLLISEGITATIIICVQGFFAFRIYRLSQSPYIPILTGILLLPRLAFYIFLMAYWAPRYPTFTEFVNGSAWIFYITWGVSMINDALVAVALSYWLYRQRRNADIRTLAVVDKIIRFSLETGVLLSFATTLSLILFATMPNNFIWISVYVVQARLYSNSFLASLNSRTNLRAMNEISISISIPADMRGGEDAEVAKNASLDMSTVESRPERSQNASERLVDS